MELYREIVKFDRIKDREFFFAGTNCILLATKTKIPYRKKLK